MLDGELPNQPDETTEQAEQPEVIPGKQPSEGEITPEKQPEVAQRAAPSLETNMRALRESKERIQRERDDMERRLREYEARENPQPKQEEEDFSLNLGENDLAEGKHLSKIQKQLKKQQEDLIRTQQQTQTLLIEARLKAEHPDIDKVVTPDNMKLLAELEPDIAKTLHSSNDYYSKAKTAYKMMKTLGIHKEDVYAADRDVALRNAAKPRPLASVSPQQGDSPLSKANAFANGLTEELKIQLRKEMEEATRNM